jgi:hypothetical protein
MSARTYKDWSYLEADCLKARNVLAAYHLRDCRQVLDVGSYVTPFSLFAIGDHDAITSVDPLLLPSESDQLNGRRCRVRHVASRLQEYTLCGEEDGFVFLGLTLVDRSPETSARVLLDYMQNCAKAVVEFSPAFPDLVMAFDQILASRQFAVRERVAFDFRHKRTQTTLT